MDTDIFKLLDARILTYYREIEQIGHGQLPAPRTAIIYPTYGCNCNCVGCEYAADNRGSTGIGRLEYDRFEKLIDELAGIGVRGIEFCGGGEPTMYPNLYRIIARGLKKGIRFGLLTNGLKLTGRLAEQAARHLSYVRFSLDSADTVTYNRVRQPAQKDAFRQVTENIRDLVKRRSELGSELRVSYKYLIGKHNLDGIEQALDLARELGVDSLQFKALRMSPQTITAAQEKKVERRIEKLRKANPDFAVLGGVQKINMEHRCRLTPLHTMIDACGDVLLCCYYRHRRASHRIGNIYDDSFEKIWHGAAHRRAIRNIKPEECNLLDCRFVRYNKIAEQLVFSGNGQFEFI
jgi:MoaA/NifB/PqqE/SkfB family radical SAM enzyme